VTWIWRARAAREHGLHALQITYACRIGILKCRWAGGSFPRGGLLVDRESLEANLEAVRALPRRWSYSTTAARRYGLTRSQIRRAAKAGLVRAMPAETGYGYTALLVALDDVEARLDEIKAMPRYTEEERERMREYARRYRLRRRLSFLCPRCGREVRPLAGSEAFEAAYRGELSPDEARRLVVVSHYRHNHTDYDKARLDIDRWLEPGDVGEFGSFKGLIDAYYERVDDMDPEEREEWIEEIRRLKGLAAERARRYYNGIAVKMAQEDGLLPAPAKGGGHSPEAAPRADPHP